MLENYENGLDWYSQHFDETENGQIIGEKTPLYSHVPEAAPKMHDVLPEPRFIWIFREFVQRTHSHYWYMAKRGDEPLSFQEAIQEEQTGQRERDIERGYLLR
jgi:hypothetical protein